MNYAAYVDNFDETSVKALLRKKVKSWKNIVDPTMDFKQKHSNLKTKIE